jgi:hypothetical protein
VNACPGCACTRRCNNYGCYGCYRPLEGMAARPPDVAVPRPPRVAVKDGPAAPSWHARAVPGGWLT